ncbi:MAG: DUF1254 domain-containing protein [Flavobacteriales bacterium]|nr:DUF1254 domain-containing protein [Flavobacteriales bacterium]MCB0814802.1 DUF1254 domain-containing protein [Flavobacteriales bacterium]
MSSTESYQSAKRLVFVLSISMAMWGCGSNPDDDGGAAQLNRAVPVTPPTFIRAESDHMFSAMIANAGGTNRFFHFRSPTPLDKQTVIRMNRDVLYSGGVFDATEGLTIEFPEVGDGRYASVEIIDNDHYVVDILHEPGIYEVESPTDFVYIIVRLHLKSPDDVEDIRSVNALQDRFIVRTGSAREFVPRAWDAGSLDSLRNVYLEEAAQYDGYKGMMGKRGHVNEGTRHIAAAGGWGLLPDEEATYLLFQDSSVKAGVSYSGTFEVPENKGFWSITVYGGDGYIKNDSSYLSGSNVVLNEDGTFTVCFGDEGTWDDSPNRILAPEGWNFLLRVYRPGDQVLNGTYELPELRPNP